MTLSQLSAALLAQTEVQPARRGARRRGEKVATGGWARWIREPRNAVWVALAALVAIGGGRRVRQWWRAREAVDRLGADDVAPATIRAAAEHGRAALFELFRILGTAETEAQRTAAGEALAEIWKRDDLITEEEKALVRRGFVATWHARRRYPRALRAPIPVTVSFCVPFLRSDAESVGPEHLEWSYRIVGAGRADLEVFRAWTPGAVRAQFAVFPDDFETNGPHRLVLDAKVRTVGLTGVWELELPHIPFSFEFDPRLAVGALLAAPDAARGEVLARAIRLERARTGEAQVYMNLNDGFALRDPPDLVIDTPLSYDLAHTVAVEFEGVDRPIAAGAVVVSGQGTAAPSGRERLPLRLDESVPPDAIARPGTRRLRLVLTPDPERGWADPDARSLWPEAITTEWIDVEIVRR